MFRRMRILVCISLCIACHTSSGFCSETKPELVTDRPDQTESSVTVPQGMVQIETGVTYSVDADGNENVSFPEMLLRLGVSPKVELRIATSGYIWELYGAEKDGFGDIETGFKARLWEEKGWRPEAALLVGLSVPFGDADFSSNNLDPSFRLSLSHTINDRLSLGYNVGVAWETESHEDSHPLFSRIYNLMGESLGKPAEENTSQHMRASFLYTAALGVGLTDRLGMFLEFFGDMPINASGGSGHSFDAGLTYLLTDTLQLDLSGGVGLNEGADNWFVGTGVSVRF